MSFEERIDSMIKETIMRAEQRKHNEFINQRGEDGTNWFDISLHQILEGDYPSDDITLLTGGYLVVKPSTDIDHEFIEKELKNDECAYLPEDHEGPTSAIRLPPEMKPTDIQRVIELIGEVNGNHQVYGSLLFNFIQSDETADRLIEMKVSEYLGYITLEEVHNVKV